MGILPFFWKTEVIFIDDDNYLLEEITAQLISQKFEIKSFIYPEEALDYIKNLGDQKLLDNLLYNQDIFELCEHQVQILTRQKIVSVLVVDYDMPNINGIDILKEVANSSCKKLMLTGHLDPSKAIDYKGELFDDYIQKKHDISIFNILNFKVEGQIKKYFQEQGKEILFYIKNNYSDALIFSDEYQEYFDFILTKLSIQEYCIMDENGSYKLKSESKEYLLYVQSEEEMSASAEEYKDIENSFLKEKIKNYSVIAVIVDSNFQVTYPEEEVLEKNIYFIDKIISFRKVKFYITLVEM